MRKYILFLSLSLFLASCGSTENVQTENKAWPVERLEQESKPTDSISTWPQGTKEECMNWCYIMWKSNSGNKNKTSVDMDKSCNNLCDASQGMQDNDPASCEKSEGILRDTCYSEIANKTTNPELCEKIKEKMFVGTCYGTIANRLKDPSLCYKVADDIAKSMCLGSVSK